MSDYPSQSPWGPHGPQVGSFSVTPNPTAPSPMPDFPQPNYGASFAQPGTPQYGGGGVAIASAGVAGGAAGTVAIRRASILPMIQRLALVGLALGALLGLARAVVLHVPFAIGGVMMLRLGIAGAAAGAGIPPAFRAFGVAVRAALWIAITAACWMLAMAAAGQLGWLDRLR